MGGAAASRAGDDTGPRDPDFSGQATCELERTRRELAVSAALAMPGSGAHLMTVRQAQAIDAELEARRQDQATGGAFSMRQAGVSGAGEDAALTGLEEAWGAGGYHAFTADQGTWSAVSSGGDVLTGASPGELDRAIRAHWQTRQ